MTLASWIAKHHPSHYPTKGGGRIVYCKLGDKGYYDLFRLSDHYLTTISGPCVYLMPRL